jgi:shikimate kinase
MLRHMLAERAPLYGEVATATVATGGRPVREVVADVLAAVGVAGAARGGDPRADA